MHYIKKFNHNVALANSEDGTEWIVMGKGVGFGKEMGDPIDSCDIERRFMAEPSSKFSYIVQTIFSIDPAIVEAVGGMIKEAEEILGLKFENFSYITMVDHINFALKRAIEGLEYSEPLKWEVKKLHTKEYQAALASIQYINKKLGVSLPKSEEIFIALHYVNAQNKGEKVPETDRINFIIRDILDWISHEYSITLDEESIDYIRFVTHLRYFIIRQIKNEPLNSNLLDKEFTDLLKTRYKTAYDTAVGIAKKLEYEENWEISQNEILFLTVHIGRITQDL